MTDAEHLNLLRLLVAARDTAKEAGDLAVDAESTANQAIGYSVVSISSFDCVAMAYNLEQLAERLKKAAKACRKVAKQSQTLSGK